MSIVVENRLGTSKHQFILKILNVLSPIGSDTLCRHNFEHNTMDGASSIMPA